MTKKPTHKIKFDSRFESKILNGTNSRTLRKNNKTNQKIESGDIIGFSRVNADGSETLIATAPITEIHGGQLDKFGMVISRAGINPARAANTASLAKLFGFDDLNQMTAFYEGIGYLKDDASFNGLVICWDPSQMEIIDAPADTTAEKPKKASADKKKDAAPSTTAPTTQPADAQKSESEKDADNKDEDGNEDGDEDADADIQELNTLIADAKLKLESATDPAERAAIEAEIKELETELSDISEGADE